MLDQHSHKPAANTQPADARPFALTAPGATPAKPAKPRKSRLASVHHMNEQYQILTTPDELRQSCEQLSNAEAIGTDCETTSLDPNDGLMRLLQLSTPEQTFIVDIQKISDREAYRPLQRVLETPGRRIISHNSKFEQKWLKAKLGIEPSTIFCTQLAHTLIDFNSSHNLETTTKCGFGHKVNFVGHKVKLVGHNLHGN